MSRVLDSTSDVALDRIEGQLRAAQQSLRLVRPPVSDPFSGWSLARAVKLLINKRQGATSGEGGIEAWADNEYRQAGFQPRGGALSLFIPPRAITRHLEFESL